MRVLEEKMTTTNEMGIFFTGLPCLPPTHIQTTSFNNNKIKDDTNEDRVPESAAKEEVDSQGTYILVNDVCVTAAPASLHKLCAVKLVCKLADAGGSRELV